MFKSGTILAPSLHINGERSWLWVSGGTSCSDVADYIVYNDIVGIHSSYEYFCRKFYFLRGYTRLLGGLVILLTIYLEV